MTITITMTMTITMTITITITKKKSVTKALNIELDTLISKTLTKEYN